MKPLFPIRAIAALVLVLLILTVFAQVARSASVTEGAIRSLMTRVIWKGERRYWHHCRDAPAGCETRIQTFSDYFDLAGNAYSVPPLLLVAIAFHESALNPAAEGRVRKANGKDPEYGIMQILPTRKTVPRFVRDPKYRAACLKQVGACQHDVVMFGAAILSKALDVCGDPLRAVAAYNTGHCDRITPYHREVIRLWKTLQGLDDA